MHKILYKGFSPSNLEKFVPVFARQTQRCAEQLEAAAITRSPIDMLLLFNELTLDVIVAAGFGEFISEDDKKVILDSFRFIMAETQNPLHDIPVLRSLPFPSNIRVNRAFKALQATADKVVTARRKELESGNVALTHEGKYMIDLLLDAKEKEDQLTDLELRDNIIMLMVAGSETTGTTLTWALWHIINNRDIHAKVMQEIEALDISWDNFHITKFDEAMPFLTSVLKETLRFTPAISGIPERIFKEPATIGDLELPAGSRVGVAQYVMHRNPDYWKDPNKFDPERFNSASDTGSNDVEGAGGNSASSDLGSRAPKYFYLPFGLGRRTCMGKFFAMNEMRVVLSLILK